ncbi:MAG: Gfo/Idh/MocA family oxidoreductase, partial [bacterium]
MSEKDIRVGIVGCGRISNAHIMGYKSFDKAQVVAVCDINEAKARAKA